MCRTSLLVLAAAILCSCSSNPSAQTASLDPGDEGRKNWCQRNQPACLPLFPLAIADWLIGAMVQNAPAAALDTIENTNVYSTTIHTPKGTVTGHTVCSFNSCDTTVKGPK